MQINQESNEPQDVPIGVNTRPAERVNVQEPVQAQGEVTELSHTKRTIPTRLGSLMVLLVAVIAGGGFWMMGVTYEVPESVADVDRLVLKIQEQRALKSIPTFVLAEEIEESFLDMQWIATSSMYENGTSSKGVFYENDIVLIEGVSFIPVTQDVDESVIISALENRGYVWKVEIQEHDFSLTGMAADGPSSSVHGMLKYDSETDFVQTVVISTERHLNEVCVENEVEWFSEEIGNNGCEVESEYEIFVSEVIEAKNFLEIGKKMLEDDSEEIGVEEDEMLEQL
jgi:hypothetical protein